MIKYIVVPYFVNDNSYWTDGSWKSEVCFDFDENVVIPESRDWFGVEGASWWARAKELISDAECMSLEDYNGYWYPTYSKDKLEAIYRACEDTSGTEDTDFIVDIVHILYPRLPISTGRIRGSCQGDVADVIFITDSVDIDTLQDWYFGNIYNVDLYELSEDDLSDLKDELGIPEEDDITEDAAVTYIRDWGADCTDSVPFTGSSLWHMTDEDIASEFGIPKDEMIYLEVGV